MDSAPSPSSPTFRTDLAKLVSPLKRLRPRVPFWKLAAHRVPTISLYRSLLRNAATEDIRFRIRLMFRQNSHVTGTERTIKFLNMGYKWLDIFKRAKQGDEHYQTVLKRYSSLIAVKSEKAYWMYLGHKEVAWQLKLLSRPILTGFFPASVSSNPYPRLKPQPVAMSMIIKKRREAAIKRFKRSKRLMKMKTYIESEAAFERQSLRVFKGKNNLVFSDMDQWMQPIDDSLREIDAARERGDQRKRQPFPDWLKEAVKEAHRERIANKTRELERERRGEVLPRTIRRRRKGPPAHILVKMTPEEKEMDKIVRHVSEVGYVGMMKRRMGMKLRNPDAWRLEVGSTRGEEGSRLKKLVQDVRRENEKRRLPTNLD